MMGVRFRADGAWPFFADPMEALEDCVVEPRGRLEASGSFNAMVSHRVRVSGTGEVDDDLVSWLRQAYEQA